MGRATAAYICSALACTVAAQPLLDSGAFTAMFRDYATEEASLTLDGASAILKAYAKQVGSCQVSSIACEQCYNVSRFVPAQTTSVPAEMLQQVAMRLVHAAVKRIDLCSGTSLATNDSSIVSSLMLAYESGGNTALTKLNSLLASLNWTQSSTIVTSAAASQCFSSSILLTRAGVDNGSSTAMTNAQFVTIISYTFIYMTKGYTVRNDCSILPTADAMAADLYAQLGDNGTRLSIKGFSSLLSNLNIGRVASASEAESAIASSTAPASSSAKSTHECMSPEQLLTMFQVDESQGGITSAQLTAMCPSLLQQHIGGYCAATAATASSKPTTAETYGYGTLAVLVVSLLSLLGVILLPCLSSKSADLILTLFTSLGVGTMLGDALMHIMPDVLGSSQSSTSTPSDATVVDESLLKMLTVCLGIYIFFLFETGIQSIRNKQSQPAQEGTAATLGHGHSHFQASDLVVHTPGKSQKELPELEKGLSDSSTKNSGSKESHLSAMSTNSDDVILKQKVKRGACENVKPFALVVIAGDTLHNCADGLAVGAAFATRLSLGLSVTIAVCCHEVPHELGNFAVLLSAGFTRGRVLGFNLLSTMSAFVGFYIGAAVGSNETVASYIFAATAATFFYVSLVDLLPTLMHKETKTPFLHFLMINIGILVGFFGMFVFAIYESSISIN